MYLAKALAKGPTACPSCGFILDDEPTACPRCGFSGEVAVRKFRFDPPELTAIIDAGQTLSADEKARLEKSLKRLGKRLPQVRFILCLVPLVPEIDLREFGFWLLNAGAMPEGDEAKSFGILFLVDSKSKRLSVTVGYGLEPMVRDSEWEEICRSLRPHFLRERYAEGMEEFVEETGKLLIERALEYKREIAKGDRR
ncbi:MAG: TPM domain-containing protein [Verrucomicrobiota bacterium JB023]|nr:TPM domain-containing protein [Verrucomicrobiota bacterium JB023]